MPETINGGGNNRTVIVGFIMVVIAFIIPFAYRVDIGPGPNSIRAMIWEYIEASWYSGFRWWNPLDTLPYTFLRLIFSYQIFRYYKGTTNKKHTVVIGLASELQPLIISVPLTYGIQWVGDPWVPLYLPIPLMLALAFLIMYVIPPKRRVKS